MLSLQSTYLDMEHGIFELKRNLIRFKISWIRDLWLVKAKLTSNNKQLIWRRERLSRLVIRPSAHKADPGDIFQLAPAVIGRYASPCLQFVRSDHKQSLFLIDLPASRSMRWYSIPSNALTSNKISRFFSNIYKRNFVQNFYVDSGKIAVGRMFLFYAKNFFFFLVLFF